jgi:hypothetical protein
MQDAEFRRVAIEPVACFREAWRRIADQYWLFFGITCVGLLLGSFVPMGLFLGPMMCGIDLCYLQRWRGEPVRFETLFKGIDHFVESLIAVLVLMGIGLVVMIPFVLAIFSGVLLTGIQTARTHSPAYGVLFAIGVAFVYALLLLVMSIVGSLSSFTFLLIVDRRLPGLDALKLSARAAWRNIGGMLGLTCLSTALGMMGMCCCYVGAFFVAPISLGAIVVAYDKVFGIASASAVTPAVAPTLSGASE